MSSSFCSVRLEVVMRLPLLPLLEWVAVVWCPLREGPKLLFLLVWAPALLAPLLWLFPLSFPLLSSLLHLLWDLLLPLLLEFPAVALLPRWVFPLSFPPL
jgi:hypothetical protein